METNTEKHSPAGPAPGVGSDALLCSFRDPRAWWQRAISRLWPWTHLHVGDLPPWAQDAIYCDHRVSLSFADRLRVLFSGRLRLRSQTLTEHKPGRVETVSLAHPLAPVWVEGDK